MKACLLVILFAVGATSVAAQEPPLPSPTSTPSPSSSVRPELNIPEIPVPVEPAPLVPNASPGPKKTVPSITELDTAFQQSSLGQAAEQQRLQVEWRKLKNRAGQDSDVIAARKAIDTGSTDVEKRDLMRAYYKLYYGRMQSLADKPEVKAYVEQKKKEILDSLNQPRVHPELMPKPTTKR